MEEEEEQMCRYCFGDASDGELISPCKCIGGQKYVHLSCLRRWQRMVLVSQPTHPAFYKDDIRQHICKVCQSKFTCPPPTRAELMESFTGPEIGALVKEGRIIASHDIVSNKMEKDLETIPLVFQESSGLKHWIRAVLLITKNESSSTNIIPPTEIPIETESVLDHFRLNLDENLQYPFEGGKAKVLCKGVLEGVSQEELRNKIYEIKAPTKIWVQPIMAGSGEDSIFAVNLTRQLVKPIHSISNILENIYEKYSQSRNVLIEHFIGGPVSMDKITVCIVTGGKNRGWTVVNNGLDSAVRLAYSRGARRYPEQGNFGGGQTVELKGLQSKPELNGLKAMTLQFEKDVGRWEVRLPNGTGIRVKPENLIGLEGSFGRVLCFWGYAVWTRTQLLGEIARGHWGLCHASISDLVASSTERWEQTKGRLAFAPVSEMTEEWLRTQGQQLMQTYQATMETEEENENDDEHPE